MKLYDQPLYIQDLEDGVRRTDCIKSLKGQKILITGASGLIGSYIIDMLMTANRLYALDILIYALGRDRRRLEARFLDIKTDNLMYIEQDVCKPFEFCCEVDYIIHAASNAYPAAFSRDPVGTMMSNLEGTFQLLEYGRKYSAKRILFVSSGEVYGQYDGKSMTYTEQYSGYVDILQSRSCYPMSKRTAETLCSAYRAQYGSDVVIVRPCHTYGPNVTASDNRANVQFIDNACKGKDIVLKSEGKQLRSYCYIADCASAIITVLLKGGSGEAYNIAYSKAEVTIADFARIAAEQAGVTVRFELPDRKDLEERSPVTRQVLDSKKLEKLGWKGAFTVERGIKHILQILKSNE